MARDPVPLGVLLELRLVGIAQRLLGIAQRLFAIGQRVWKWQPVGGFNGFRLA